MNDREASEGKDPILDDRGLMTDVQQLRFLVHELACTLHSLLELNPLMAMVIGADLYVKMEMLAAAAHAVSCETTAQTAHQTSTPPPADDPIRKLFEQTWPEGIGTNADAPELDSDRD